MKEPCFSFISLILLVSRTFQTPCVSHVHDMKNVKNSLLIPVCSYFSPFPLFYLKVEIPSLKAITQGSCIPNPDAWFSIAIRWVGVRTVTKRLIIGLMYHAANTGLLSGLQGPNNWDSTSPHYGNNNLWSEIIIYCINNFGVNTLKICISRSGPVSKLLSCDLKCECMATQWDVKVMQNSSGHTHNLSSGHLVSKFTKE